MNLHKKQKGTIGEYKIMTDLLQNGHAVFNECGDFSKVDLIMLYNNLPYKIQVKSYNAKNNKITIKTHSSGPGYNYYYTSDDIDLFAIYILNLDIILYVPFSIFTEYKTFTLQMDNNIIVNDTYNYKHYMSIDKCISNIDKPIKHIRNYKHTPNTLKKIASSNKHTAELIEARKLDYHEDDKSYGMVVRLSKKWNVAHTQVRRFIKKHIE